MKLSSLYHTFLSKLNKDIKILEVGCNIGKQLEILKSAGFNNLWGIDINEKALYVAKNNKKFNIVYGSAFDLPFKDNFFDLVFTSFVLIHIHPDDEAKAIREMYRVTNKYIFGIEYFSEECEEVVIRGHKNRCWKRNFPSLFRKEYPKLAIMKKKQLPYLRDKNVDIIYLLKK